MVDFAHLGSAALQEPINLNFSRSEFIPQKAYRTLYQIRTSSKDVISVALKTNSMSIGRHSPLVLASPSVNKGAKHVSTNLVFSPVAEYLPKFSGSCRHSLTESFV